MPPTVAVNRLDLSPRKDGTVETDGANVPAQSRVEELAAHGPGRQVQLASEVWAGVAWEHAATLQPAPGAVPALNPARTTSRIHFTQTCSGELLRRPAVGLTPSMPLQ